MKAGSCTLPRPATLTEKYWDEPRQLRGDAGGATTMVARGTRNGPWNGMTAYRGAFLVAEGGEAEGGRILRMTPDGKTETLTSDLPSVGDHHTNGPMVKDGYLCSGRARLPTAAWQVRATPTMAG